MLKVGINGFGRIGRAIFRTNMNKKLFEVVAINDINPDIENIAYQLNYDTLYDQLKDKFQVEKDHIYNGDYDLKVFQKKHIDEVDWKSKGVDIVIDASGILDNTLRGHKTIEKQGVKKVIVTHSPNEVDFTMVLGANEDKLDLSKHHVISSSICDATAIGPVLKIIKDNFGINSGHLTTLHPWLGYQNLMDGPASSWSVPGEIYHHFALGRSAIGNMIPKPTSALSASCKVVDDISPELIGSYSIRTPTHIVGCADITLVLKENTTQDEVIKAFEDYSNAQKWDIINNNFEPLVSLDFKGSEFSANVDHRFTSLVQGNMLKLVLWYDNEWGYATKVCEQVNYIQNKMED
ncbi:glyceraldehyde 3-phosphate dehydrogenase NAD-binding domain-containing protein [Clostridium sp.]|jgi:glyceraldehyde 3-phosphate dehydrogenase|uniref:glyceraldehyde 3-phosphate dehydrogenase NAD-binding domain-containing protein n=1 Tax=Clostridium sp. TaxID=1506 RepID=UPI003EEACD00